MWVLVKYGQWLYYSHIEGLSSKSVEWKTKSPNGRVVGSVLGHLFCVQREVTLGKNTYKFLGNGQ